MSGKDIAGDGAGSTNRDVGRLVNVNVRPLNGSMFNVWVKLNSTVRDLRVVATGNCAIPAEQQVLIYGGRIMTDDRTLESFGIEDDASVELVPFRGAGIINASLVEQTLEELGQTTEILENLRENPETIRILRLKISLILAACDRNLIALRRLREKPNPYSSNSWTGKTGKQKINSHPFLAYWNSGGSQTNSGAGVDQKPISQTPSYPSQVTLPYLPWVGPQPAPVVPLRQIFPDQEGVMNFDRGLPFGLLRAVHKDDEGGTTSSAAGNMEQDRPVEEGCVTAEE